MDFFRKLAVDNNGDSKASHDTHTHDRTAAEQGGNNAGFMDRMSNKFNSAAGGGRQSEKDEDLLDKGVDFVQEKFLGKGKQDNESAIEQAKDEKISDAIRKGYKSVSGKEIPIKDKPTRFG
ncbi:hypothetical protein GcM1_161011 [Golovinomyces cichoracearum]|uniref:Uncharacterized protein n=1 Tax=Golovinomyces cichoracearum TaxID=62708 RepID=A0A420J904_9PEZI|nr:hypothetical protein GcM1_161011 [Golovinomyces cichoracearum]